MNASHNARARAVNAVPDAVRQWNATHPEREPVFLPLTLRVAIGEHIADVLTAEAPVPPLSRPPVAQRGPDGTLHPLPPMPPQGPLARIEMWLRRRNRLRRLADFLGDLEEQDS